METIFSIYKVIIKEFFRNNDKVCQQLDYLRKESKTSWLAAVWLGLVDILMKIHQDSKIIQGLMITAGIQKKEIFHQLCQGIIRLDKMEFIATLIIILLCQSFMNKLKDKRIKKTVIREICPILSIDKKLLLYDSLSIIKEQEKMKIQLIPQPINFFLHVRNQLLIKSLILPLQKKYSFHKQIQVSQQSNLQPLGQMGTTNQTFMILLQKMTYKNIIKK